MHLTKNKIKLYTYIVEDIQRHIYAYFDEFIKCDDSYELLDWELIDNYEFTITYSCIDSETGDVCSDYFTITLDELDRVIED